MLLFPNSGGAPEPDSSYTEFMEKWSAASRAAAAAARGKRGASPPIFAKALSGKHSRHAMLPSAAHHRIDRKHAKHDVVNPNTGEVSNTKFDSVRNRFMRKFRKTTFRATLAAKRGR